MYANSKEMQGYGSTPTSCMWSCVWLVVRTKHEHNEVDSLTSGECTRSFQVLYCITLYFTLLYKHIQCQRIYRIYFRPILLKKNFAYSKEHTVYGVFILETFSYRSTSSKFENIFYVVYSMSSFF